MPRRADSENVGIHSGVAAVSSFPCRALPSQWSQQTWQSGRIQAVAALVHVQWIVGGMAYGYSPGQSNPRAREHTDLLLEELENRIVWNATGPRFLGGNFNLEPATSVRFERWRRAGFVEVQEAAFTRWGVEPRATCKGATRVDQLWFSAELAALEAVQVDESHFADQAPSSLAWRPHRLCGGACPSPSSGTPN